MSDIESWIKEYESRSLAGRFSFLFESGARLASTAIERVVDQTAAVVARTRKSLIHGLDPNIDEAHILEERIEPAEEDTMRPSGE